MPAPYEPTLLAIICFVLSLSHFDARAVRPFVFRWAQMQKVEEGWPEDGGGEARWTASSRMKRSPLHTSR